MMDAWGKFDKDDGVHPLAHHSMDVAAVFARMMKLPIIRNRVETAAGMPLTDADCRRLSALVFLHDIGKLHPGFQAKGWSTGLWNGPTRSHLSEGWSFLMLAYNRPEHPFHKTMGRILEWGESVGPLIAAIIAHHGRPVNPPLDPTLRDWNSPAAPHYDWCAEARVMDEALHRWFSVVSEAEGTPLPDRPQCHHAVAGLVALSDWIGSDKRFFRFTEPVDRDYNSVAHDAAMRALTTIGFDSVALTACPAPDFSTLTGFSEPNSAQRLVGTVGPAARLLILEAETGSGKTKLRCGASPSCSRRDRFRGSTSPCRRARRQGNFMAASAGHYTGCSAQMRRKPCSPFPVCCAQGSSTANVCLTGAYSGTMTQYRLRIDGPPSTRRDSWRRRSLSAR